MYTASNLNKLLEILKLAAQQKWEELVILSGAAFSELDDIPSYVIRLGGAERSYRPPKLPDEIFQIRSLKRLTVSAESLITLSPEIENLIELESLDLSWNLLSSIPIELWNLTRLKSLDLSRNAITTLPSEIGQLTNLSSLDLSHNQLTALPFTIWNLSSITSLDLSDLKLTSLPAEVERLIHLSSLNISGNHLNTLPPGIGQLSSLSELDLSRNHLTQVPEEIRYLKNLRILDLQENHLPVPVEILSRISEPRAIIDYYLTLTFLGLESKPLNECKVIIVGEGNVGKTSLTRRLILNEFNKHETITEGISINRWQVDDQSKIPTQPTQIQLNLWDFGGQEIMHATHQFFLTKRSLYVLVLDTRLSQEENRVEYWLKIIQSYGGESPVLIVGNKVDQHPLDLDRSGLLKKYPNVVGVLETSAATGTGIDMLKKAVIAHANQLPHVHDLLPGTWQAVKTQLEKLGREQNFITHDHYVSLCMDNNISDETSQRTLIGFLHDLGIVLHFQDDSRLEALGILNPQWVTNGVYRIINSHALFQNKGVLTVALLNEILNLPEYPRSKRLFIIDMMRRFELCYDIEPDQTFLIPDLLPKDEPYTGEWNDALAFQYHYNVLPSSIITRLIVRLNNFIHKTIWRSGVVLKRGGNTALVKADLEERKIYIQVCGDEPTRRDFLSAIRTEFDAIHRTIVKIEAIEKVPVPGKENVVVDFGHLLNLERLGEDSFIPEGLSQRVSVRELLNGIARPEERKRRSKYIASKTEPTHPVKTAILFLAADPSNATRLRLGEEHREIKQKLLQIARLRDQFDLHECLSARPEDISQALLDVLPGVVHFAGHGEASGALCFEDQLGRTQLVDPDALAALFEQFADHVHCVILNACYSAAQAQAIAKHIDYVIGMDQEIGDRAAIEFAKGFYQALGAGKGIEDAYKLGCVQIKLQRIPKELTPKLIKRQG